MSKHLQRDLDELQHDVLRMGGAVEEAIHTAIRALQTRDVQMARSVIAGDSESASMRLARLRHGSAQHPIQHDAERPHVGAMVEVLDAAQLLGSHV